jgi:small subunit ribosomal protein S8
MSAQDPIADMLTRIRNALAVKKKRVSMPWSQQKQRLADLLVEEGYLSSAEKIEVEGTVHFTLVLDLKYFEEESVINELKRISRPGLRIYRGYNELPLVDSGLGISVISTSEGFMSNHKAKRRKLGGEVLFSIS